MSRNYQNHPELYPSVREQEEAEYQGQVAALFMTYDCEDPEDRKIIERKLKELNDDKA